MTDVDRLLREYIEEHRAGGEADPLAYVERLEGTDRAELEALIDAYLARAPARDALRRAGERVAPSAAAEGAVFARTAHPDADYREKASAARGQASPALGTAPERDEVDELFLGG